MVIKTSLFFLHALHKFARKQLAFDFTNLPKEDEICVIFKVLELVKIRAIRV